MKKIIVTAFFGLFANFCLANNSNETIYLKVRFEKPENPDTVSLSIWKHYFGNLYNKKYVENIYAYPNDDGFYEFKIASIKNPVYLTLKYNKQIPINLFLGLSGDSIDITIYKDSIGFKGKGHNKYTYQFEANKLTEKTQQLLLKEKAKYNEYLQRNFLNYCKIIISESDFLLSKQLKYIDECKTKLSKNEYDILKANIVGSTIVRKYAMFSSTKQLMAGYKIIEPDQKNVDSAYLVLKKSLQPLIVNSCTENLQYAKDYIISQVLAAQVIAKQEGKKTVLEQITGLYEGAVREQLLLTYLTENFRNVSNFDSTLQLINPFIKNPALRVHLLNLKNLYSKGLMAYNFKLPNPSGQIVSLKDYYGKTVVIDVWFTGCIGCAQFYKNALSIVQKKYKDTTDIVFISISVDKEKAKWLSSIKEGIYTSAEHINLFTGGSGRDNPFIKHYNIIACPTLVLIDKKGKIDRISTAVRDPVTLETLISSLNKEKGL